MAAPGTLDALVLALLVLAPAAALVVLFQLLAWLRDDDIVEQLGSAESGTTPEHVAWDGLGPEDERPADGDRREGLPGGEDDAVRCRTCGTENVPHARFCRRCVSEL